MVLALLSHFGRPGVVLAALVLVAIAGCGERKDDHDGPAGQTPSPAAQTESDKPAPLTAGEAPKAPGTYISLVVFLDQEDCCNCTRDRQEATWKNLQTALEGLAERPEVDVVHMDSQEENARPYLDLKPVMVLPGIYFFDSSHVLTEMLQGELSVEQIRNVLQRPAGAGE